MRILSERFDFHDKLPLKSQVGWGADSWRGKFHEIFEVALASEVNSTPECTPISFFQHPRRFSASHIDAMAIFGGTFAHRPLTLISSRPSHKGNGQNVWSHEGRERDLSTVCKCSAVHERISARCCNRDCVNELD